MESYERDKVSGIIKELGYDSKYISNGSFFKIINKEKNYLFQLNICLKYGLVEFIPAVYQNNVLLVGTSFGAICVLMGREERILKPSFASYDELRNILKDGLKIFEDVNSEFLNL